MKFLKAKRIKTTGKTYTLDIKMPEYNAFFLLYPLGIPCT